LIKDAVNEYGLLGEFKGTNWFFHAFFRDGVAFDRLVGFQDLGGVDDFPTSRLENWLSRKG
jgi:hypothetical protein